MISTNFLLSFFLIILIFVNISEQQNDNQRINEGASTSRQDASRCEECELNNLATALAHLMLAQDRYGGDLLVSMNNRTDEMHAFHEEVYTYLVLAKYGTRVKPNKSRENRRLHIFFRLLRDAVTDVLMKACSEHYYHDSWYEYDPDRNLIMFTENLTLRRAHCLCWNYDEMRMHNDSTYEVPGIDIPSDVFQFHIGANEAAVYEVTQYHIIPLAMIKRFFEYWLTGESDVPNVEGYNENDCVLTLVSRLRRSMFKVILARIKRSLKVSNNLLTDPGEELNEFHLFSNDSLYIGLFSQASSWLGGNIFLGPRNRGPFNPSFERSGREWLEAFDTDAINVIDPSHYFMLVSLYFKMRQFVVSMADQTPVSRLLDGFTLFVTLCNLVIGKNITPMRGEQWEERFPTNLDLGRVESPSRRRELREKKFWAIKDIYEDDDDDNDDDNDHHPREKRDFSRRKDLNKLHENYTNVQLSKNELLRFKWGSFIEEVTKIIIEPQKSCQSNNWICNYVRLHKEHFFKKDRESTKNLDCPKCNGFSDYLYSKVYYLADWKKCNDKSQQVEENWCKAWQKIMKDLSQIKDYTSYLSYQNRFNEPKLVSFKKNVEVFMDWLLSLFERKNTVKKDLYFITLRSANAKPHDVVSEAFCYLTTFSVNILVWKKSQCSKFF